MQRTWYKSIWDLRLFIEFLKNALMKKQTVAFQMCEEDGQLNTLEVNDVGECL